MFKFNRYKTYDISLEFPVHVISPDSHDEKTVMRNMAMRDMLEQSGFRDFHFLRGAYFPRQPSRGCALSHAMAIERALKRATGPFLLLENDAMLDEKAPVSLEVEMPNDADAIYFGISTGGLAFNSYEPTHHWMGNFYSLTPSKDLVRVYNMLSTHAVAICSERMARNWQLCALEAAMRDVPVDTLIAKTLKHFNVYAQRKPWFYQAEHLGGQERYTKIEFQGTQVRSVADLPVQLPSFTNPCIAADLAALR